MTGWGLLSRCSSHYLIIVITEKSPIFFSLHYWGKIALKKQNLLSQVPALDQSTGEDGRAGPKGLPQSHFCHFHCSELTNFVFLTWNGNFPNKGMPGFCPHLFMKLVLFIMLFLVLFQVAEEEACHLCFFLFLPLKRQKKFGGLFTKL